MKRIMVALATAMALCLALAGCGGGADPAKNFIGTWEISSIETDGEVMGDDVIALMRSFGANCLLKLEENGTASFDMWGEIEAGTWEAKDASTATLKSADGETIEMKLADKELSLTQSGDKLVFVLNNDAKPSDPSAFEGLDGDDGDDEGDEGDETEAVMLNQVLADDEFCTFEIVSMGADWAGDPGFNIKVTNKHDTPISVSATWDEWSVGGKMIDPAFSVTVKPGAYAEEFLYFNSSDLGGGTEKLVDVDGVFTVYDDDYNELAVYQFTF